MIVAWIERQRNPGPSLPTATLHLRFAWRSTRVTYWLFQGESHAEVEDRDDTGTGLRGRRYRLGLCAAEAGSRILRVARLYGAARKTRRACGAFRELHGGDLCAPRHHQCRLLDSAAKRSGTRH